MSGTTSSPNQAYGFVLGAGIAKGRVTAIETWAGQGRARRAGVVTTLDMPSCSTGK